MKVKATESALKLIEDIKAQHGEELLFINQVDVAMEVLQCAILEKNTW